MTPLQELALSKLKLAEGGYVNDPNDRGGETNHGLTVKVAREEGYTGSMRDMPLDFAQKVFIRRYWHPLNLDVIGKEMPHLAVEMFDAAINCGVFFAGIWLQYALNAVNEGGIGDLRADGQVGPKTLAAVAALQKRRNEWAEQYLRATIECQQGQRYLNIALRNPTQRRFMYGWIMNRILD